MTKQKLGRKVWYDPDSKGYIGLDITDTIPPQTRQTIEAITLLPKDEYHCSLVAVRRYCKDREYEQPIAHAIEGFLKTHDLRYISLGDERYLCRKDDQTTLVAPVTIEGIKEFQAFVRTLIPGYQPPFSHVTLLKSETTELGIGVNSEEDLSRYCKKIA